MTDLFFFVCDWSVSAAKIFKKKQVRIIPGSSAVVANRESQRSGSCATYGKEKNWFGENKKKNLEKRTTKKKTKTETLRWKRTLSVQWRVSNRGPRKRPTAGREAGEAEMKNVISGFLVGGLVCALICASGPTCHLTLRGVRLT